MSQRTKIQDLIMEGIQDVPEEERTYMADTDSFISTMKALYGDGCFYDPRGCLWCKNEAGDYEIVQCSI